MKKERKNAIINKWCIELSCVCVYRQEEQVSPHPRLKTAPIFRGKSKRA